MPANLTWEALLVSSCSPGPAYRHSCIAGAALGLAWLVPNSALSVVLGWVAALFLASFARKCGRRKFVAAFLGGLIAMAIGFHWLLFTIEHFGGFQRYAAASIFGLFLAGSAVQFIIFALLHSILPKSLETLCLRSAMAWSLAEIFSIRIFPWHLGHTQLSFQPFAQVASLGGAALISLLMVWCCDGVLRVCDCAAKSKASGKSRVPLCFGVLPIILFAASLGYGFHRIDVVSSALRSSTTPLEIAVVQGDISLEQKHSRALVAVNFRHYLTLSKPHLSPERLIIWPETALTDWVPDEVGSAARDPYLRELPMGNSFLIGALSFSENKQLYNSAVAIQADGTVPAPYHKRILMPFGEYTPLGDLLPWLRELNSTAGEFSEGTATAVFDYQFAIADGATQNVKVSPLICYEDIVPSLSRDAVNAGAELLVNMSNDAWFGQSIAPRQHHLIASFRAIETSRYLVRATNSGLSAVVDPLGKTTSQISEFLPGTMSARVTPLKSSTLFTQFNTMLIWQIFLGLSIIGGIFERLIASK